MAIPGTDGEDLSASATVIAFDPPIPLLRGPLPAGRSDDPSIGPFVLAFRDERSWRSAYQVTESKIIEQCEAGARVGCSINASAKCKPPWWKAMFGATAMDFSEREQCEEREMSACLVAARESCVQFAKDKCLPVFRDARIALPYQKGVGGLLFWANPTSNSKSSAEVAELEPITSCQLGFGHSSKCDAEETNYRGSVLLEGGISTGASEDESSYSGKLRA
ncbi:uncharacterized protein LOC131251776 [Magnolia sinica]|uniref:uncharacterized protein LOC131251776 n=1 Tax=Magnolia sinica TaxID=86752 RepID=UPI002659C639|nr:uncharacterized protein LOC131251776 [Magnolia sinica]